MKIAILWFILLAINLVGVPAFGQDFEQLLDAVDKLSVNLKKLVVHESEQRTLQFAKLEKRINALNKHNSTSLDLTQFKKELAELKIQNQQLLQEKNNSIITEDQLLELINEVEISKAEIKYFKDLINENPTLLASLELSELPQSNHDESQYQQMSKKLNILKENIELLAAKQKQPVQQTLKSKTSINGRLYSHGLLDFSNGDDSFNEFAISRAYVTLKSKLSNSTGLRITSDIRSIDDKYNIILKYAYLDWKPAIARGNARIRFGLQPTLYIDNMNKLWGRRYIEKTVSDKQKFLTSSDLGISSIIRFGPKSKYGFISVALLNGTSYTHVQELNNNKDFNIVSLVKPFKKIKTLSKSTLLMQLYSGTQNNSLDDINSVDTTSFPWETTTVTVEASDWKRQIVSIGGLLAWNSALDIGFDINFTKIGIGAGNDDINKKGLSFFSTFYLNKLLIGSSLMNSINFFGRIDIYDPNTNNSNDGSTLGIIGIESVPVKGFKVALNYRSTNFEDETKSNNNKIYLNTLFKF